MKQIVFILIMFFTMPIVGYANPHLPPVTAANQEQFQQVQAMLSRADNLVGNFKQTQKIALLSKPLVSSGHFVLSKNKGLEWYQEKPFRSKLIVTASQIEQQIENNPPSIITKEQQPIIFSFSNLFLSIFNGDTKNITDYFDLYFSGDISRWNIILKPLDAPLNKAISSIEMFGEKYISSITINQVKNNQMIIQFFNIQESQN